MDDLKRSRLHNGQLGAVLHMDLQVGDPPSVRLAPHSVAVSARKSESVRDLEEVGDRVSPTVVAKAHTEVCSMVTRHRHETAFGVDRESAGRSYRHGSVVQMLQDRVSTDIAAVTTVKSDDLDDGILSKDVSKCIAIARVEANHVLVPCVADSLDVLQPANSLL